MTISASPTGRGVTAQQGVITLGAQLGEETILLRIVKEGTMYTKTTYGDTWKQKQQFKVMTPAEGKDEWQIVRTYTTWS